MNMRLSILLGLATTIVLAPRLLRAADPARAGAPAAPEALSEGARSAAEGALKYLAAHQGQDGSWADGHGSFGVAVTSYGLLAFAAAGHLPGADGPYRENLARAVKYLLAHQDERGYFRAAPKADRAGMYEHGLAVLTLSELYALTRDDTLRSPLQRAVKLTAASQNDAGGWRYEPDSRDADVSVSGLQLIALRAARAAGADVPDRTLERALAYVRSCRREDGSFKYQPDQAGIGQGFARSGVGTLALTLSVEPNSPELRNSIVWLAKHRETDLQWSTYGLFYASAVQYIAGGDEWARWYDQVSKLVLKRARHDADGVYWEPTSTHPDGRAFTAAVYVCVLTLPEHRLPMHSRPADRPKPATRPS